MNEAKKYAIIVAGGKGTRIGGRIPKQFLPLLGKPILCHALQAFHYAFRDIKLILVVPHDQVDGAKTILKSYVGGLNITTVAGGETRFHSVQNGLKQVKDDGIVFIHDAVRPMISEKLIYRCFDAALTMGSAIPVVPVSDSMRLIDESGRSHPINRDNLRIVQTPQTFLTSIILPAFNCEYKPAFTDEASVVEARGTKVHLVQGELDNIKITNPVDMAIADTLLKSSV
jgi:2-C-methyl-D-erythritol 4-phosphate cytidylyltransferase